MCGFVGFLSDNQTNGIDCVNAVLQRMADRVVARGPDGFGAWQGDSGIALAHRRLSILDLSAAGHQPMACYTGRYVIAFNGEIYNHLALRDELERAHSASSWRGHSDTETLLVGFVVWGIRATLERCIGMFAFAVWDKSERVLTLGRDRLGEKPL